MRCARKRDVGGKRNKSSGNVGPGNRHRASDGAPRIRLFEAELEAHHKIHPGLGMLAERFHHRNALLGRHAIGVKYPADFGFFLLRNLADFAFLALSFLLIVFRIAARRKIASQSHGDRPGGNFRQPANDNHPRVLRRPRKSSRQRKGHSQSVRHPNHHVADKVPRSKVPLDMRSNCHRVRPPSEISDTPARCEPHPARLCRKVFALLPRAGSKVRASLRCASPEKSRQCDPTRTATNRRSQS